MGQAPGSRRTGQGLGFPRDTPRATATTQPPAPYTRTHTSKCLVSPLERISVPAAILSPDPGVSPESS